MMDNDPKPVSGKRTAFMEAKDSMAADACGRRKRKEARKAPEVAETTANSSAATETSPEAAPTEDYPFKGYKASFEEQKALAERYKVELGRAQVELDRVQQELGRVQAESDRKQAELDLRKSAEAALPALPDGRVYTPAQTFVLLDNKESLRSLVGEQYESLGEKDVLRIVKSAATKPSLVCHDTNRGFVFEGEEMVRILVELRRRVRVAVRNVGDNAGELEAIEGLEPPMMRRLAMPSTIASQIDEAKITSALLEYLGPTRTIALDDQAGFLNLVGPKLVDYNRTAGELELVDRNADLHRVHRTTGVDCAWLDETEGKLSSEMQKQYDAFVKQNLCRWIINEEVRHYVLCATADALFGGATTRIKSSLLLIGDHDQAKSTLLNALVGAGGWTALEKGKDIDTSRHYSYGNADPNALGGASGVHRNAMLTATAGLRLVKFNELESTRVWDGIKGLSNMEAQSVTIKNQSSGRTTIDLVETPYALLSTNKPPTMPPGDVKTKVAVITPAMLGRFVVDADKVDGSTAFLKDNGLDCSNDQGPMLRAMWRALKEHYAGHPGEPFDHEKHMPECMKVARDDPATWGGGGAGGSGCLSPEVEAEVTEQIKERCAQKNLVVLRDLLVEPSAGKRRATVAPLSPLALAPLGPEDELMKAKNPHCKIPTQFFDRLMKCCRLALPDWTFDEQKYHGRRVKGVTFMGDYAVPPSNDSNGLSASQVV